jgi:hypothetical protein
MDFSRPSSTVSGGGGAPYGFRKRFSTSTIMWIAAGVGVTIVFVTLAILGYTLGWFSPHCTRCDNEYMRGQNETYQAVLEHITQLQQQQNLEPAQAMGRLQQQITTTLYQSAATAAAAAANGQNNTKTNVPATTAHTQPPPRTTTYPPRTTARAPAPTHSATALPATATNRFGTLPGLNADTLSSSDAMATTSFGTGTPMEHNGFSNTSGNQVDDGDPLF